MRLMRSLSSFAVHQLATVDYTVANRVTEDVSTILDWSYAHDRPELATFAVDLLQNFDFLGSVLIAITVWLVHHTP